MERKNKLEGLMDKETMRCTQRERDSKQIRDHLCVYYIFIECLLDAEHYCRGWDTAENK